MSLVVINALHKSYGGQEVLGGVNLEINAGAHLGLVGRNGSGKTTLLKLIAGLERPSGGHISVDSGVRIGYLEQDPLYNHGRTLYAEVREGIAALDRIEEELRLLEHQLADPEILEDENLYRRILDRYSRVHDRFEARDGWRADSRVEAVLDGLKVPRSDWERDVSTFSGGERNLIGLARILVQDPDVMLLDEPGNHLDFEGLDWLESVLRKAGGAFVLVSHNRYLLDRVCTSIWELERGNAERYAGNYSAYRAEKLIRIEKLEAAAKRQEKERRRLRFQIQRLKSWASVYDNPKLARTAKRFERRIENMQTVERIREDRRKLGVSFQAEKTRGDIALQVNSYSRRYDNGPLLIENASFLISQGERTALVGANGTGKSTLVKDVVRMGKWENPILRVGPSMKIGYFAQMGEFLEGDNNLLDETIRLTGLLRTEAEKLLYRFLFTRDDFEKPVRVLSGGEKARVQLAALMASGANFLILDEPTNHLDIQSREAVEDALEDFRGTMLVISHDRYFLDKMVERVLFLDPPEIKPYEGNFSDFWRLLKEKREETETLEFEKNDGTIQEEKEKRGKAHRKIRFNAERFAFLESEIERLEEQVSRLSNEIRLETEKGNSKREAAKRQRRNQARRRLEEIYEEWFAMGNRKERYD